MSDVPPVRVEGDRVSMPTNVWMDYAEQANREHNALLAQQPVIDAARAMTVPFDVVYDSTDAYIEALENGIHAIVAALAAAPPEATK